MRFGGQNGMGWTRAIGLAAAMLALVGQIALGAAVFRGFVAEASGVGLAASVPICHGASSGDETPAPPAHRGADCAMCPLCLALASPAVLPAPPVPPRPRAVPVRHRAPLPPARAPPGAAVLAAFYPTGPPRLA